MGSQGIEIPMECSIPLPSSLDNRIYIRLARKERHVLLFLTTAALDEQAGATPLGSFVYALPDRFNAAQPLATTLYSTEATLEFATRMARLLAKKTQLPVYVSSSLSLTSTTLGGTVEEEMEAFKAVAGVVLESLKDVVDLAAKIPNGV